MRRSVRVAALAAAGAILAGVTCSFPTDQSSQVFVTVTFTAPLVVQGAQITAHAHAFHNTPAGPAEIHNVDFQWSVSADTIARVQASPGGIATITGVNPGLVRVTATASLYEKSTPKDSVIRVAKALEIDSIKPDSIRFGGRITVYGVGINSIFLAELGPGILVPDTFSFKGNRNGLGQMKFWVPSPSHTSQFFGFGPGVFGSAPETTFVGDRDIYEPNDTSPSLIDLDSAGPIAQLPNIRFFNPALEFEALDRNSTFGIDWYRFSQGDSTQPVTFVFSAPGSGRDTTIFNLLTDSIYYNGGGYFFGDSAWGIGPSSGLYACHGEALFLPQATSDSIIVEMANLTSQQFHLFAEYTSEGRYGMEVVRGLVQVDPKVAPDRFAPNQVCNQADANFANPATTISVNLGSLPFVDTTLTIDVPHAVDWYRFHLEPLNAGDLQDTVTIAIDSRTPGAQDTSDLDLTVVDQTFFQFYDQASDSGSTETITAVLTTGTDYYVIVSDFAGAPVRYGLCIKVASTCAQLPAPIPAPPGAVRGLSRRASLARSRPTGAATAPPALQVPSRGRIPLRRP